MKPLLALIGIHNFFTSVFSTSVISSSPSICLPDPCIFLSPSEKFSIVNTSVQLMDGHIHDTCHQVLFQTRNFSCTKTFLLFPQTGFPPLQQERLGRSRGRGSVQLMDGHIHDTCHQVLFQTRNFSCTKTFLLFPQTGFPPLQQERLGRSRGRGSVQLMDGHIHDTCHQVLFQTRNFSCTKTFLLFPQTGFPPLQRERLGRSRGRGGGGGGTRHPHPTRFVPTINTF